MSNLWIFSYAHSYRRSELKNMTGMLSSEILKRKSPRKKHGTLKKYCKRYHEMKKNFEYEAHQIEVHCSRNRLWDIYMHNIIVTNLSSKINQAVSLSFFFKFEQKGNKVHLIWQVFRHRIFDCFVYYMGEHRYLFSSWPETYKKKSSSSLNKSCPLSNSE